MENGLLSGIPISQLCMWSSCHLMYLVDMDVPRGTADFYESNHDAWWEIFFGRILGSCIGHYAAVCNLRCDTSVVW